MFELEVDIALLQDDVLNGIIELIQPYFAKIIRFTVLPESRGPSGWPVLKVVSDNRQVLTEILELYMDGEEHDDRDFIQSIL
jgi:hypothetical protein